MAEKRGTSQAQGQGGATQGTLDAKLLGYFAMATGALLAAPPAEAAVVYSGVKNLSLDAYPGAVFSLGVDLDNNGINDFAFHRVNYISHFVNLNYGNIYTFNSFARGATRVLGFYNALNIPTGSPIGPDLAWSLAGSFRNGLLNGSLCSWVNHHCYGAGFFNNATAYIGVKFNIGSQKHYGWIQYHGYFTGKVIIQQSGTIIDWAYESTPDTPIQAGDIGTAPTTTTTTQPTTTTTRPSTTTTTVQPTTTTTVRPTTTTTAPLADTDGDGIPDIYDNCPTIYNQWQRDSDGDGIGDACDPTPGCGGAGQPYCEYFDTDGDGIQNRFDNCPTVYNPKQLDADGDGIGDACDPTPGCGTGCGQPACEAVADTDHDMVIDILDNCPSVFNPYQLDANNNGTGDCCDANPGCGGNGQPECDTYCTRP